MEHNKQHGRGALTVYAIADKESGEKRRWTEVGKAFVNRDASITIYLNAVPISGALQVREAFSERASA